MGRGRLGSGSQAGFRELRFGVRGAVDGSPLRVCFGGCRQKRERSEVMNIDRKGIVGIVLAVVGFGGWQVYYTRQVQRAADAQKQAVQAAKAAEPAVVPGASGSQAAPVAASQPAPETAAAGGAAAVSAKEEKTPLKIGSTEYVFSNLGGGVVAARLLGHKSEQGAVLVLNEFGEVPIGAVTEVAGDGVRKPHSFEVEPGGRAIRFERTDARQVRWVKRFVLPSEESVSKGGAGEYGLRLELTVTNQGGEPLTLPGYYVHAGSAAPLHQRDMPIYTGFHMYRDNGGKFVDLNWFNGGGFFSRRTASETFTESAEKLSWVGVTNQYFCSLVTSDVDLKATSEVQRLQYGNQAWARRFSVSDAAWLASGRSTEGAKAGVPRQGVDAALGLPGRVLNPGEGFTQGFELYVGPREYGRLAKMGQDQADILAFGTFGLVSKFLLSSMNVLKGWLGSYAWAIVVLTLIIKTVLWPMQNKATASMKRMSALQPLMTQLREKYKDDPARLNAEVMQLYKDYQVNPFGGCLPMLVQIPIFFGFYNMLGKAVELRNSSFLWVQDLSQPDTVARLLNFPINVLPLIMAVTMFVQMAIQPKSGDPAQQRIFMFMPLIFIFFCYNFASALALYWTVQNLFSIVQLLATKNQETPKLEKMVGRTRARA